MALVPQETQAAGATLEGALRMGKQYLRKTGVSLTPHIPSRHLGPALLGTQGSLPAIPSISGFLSGSHGNNTFPTRK